MIIVLNNYTNLGSFEESLKSILDEMYLLKHKGSTQEQVERFHRRNWIREDIEMLFTALKLYGITVKWQPDHNKKKEG